MPVNLNEPDGADAQCAFNHSSLLCGSYQPGLSLSLGSSLYLSCPSHWPALFTAVTIAGLVAQWYSIGCISTSTQHDCCHWNVKWIDINFNANILYANKSLLLQHQGIKFMAVIISWLNLALGIDVCYFPEMDAYIKV